jgi:polyhydroxyalkanoate synthesis regulator protein
MPDTNPWGEFVKMQGPAIQALMTSYLEQSAHTFLEMQKQARNIFEAFQVPNFANPYAASNVETESEAKTDKDSEAKPKS